MPLKLTTNSPARSRLRRRSNRTPALDGHASPVVTSPQAEPNKLPSRRQKLRLGKQGLQLCRRRARRLTLLTERALLHLVRRREPFRLLPAVAQLLVALCVPLRL